MSQAIDLFEQIDELPEEVQAILQKYESEDATYAVCMMLERELAALGYTFSWGLDATPHNLRKASSNED